MVNFSELFNKLIIHNFLRACGFSLGQVVFAHFLTPRLIVMKDTCIHSLVQLKFHCFIIMEV